MFPGGLQLKTEDFLVNEDGSTKFKLSSLSAFQKNQLLAAIKERWVGSSENGDLDAAVQKATPKLSEDVPPNRAALGRSVWTVPFFPRKHILLILAFPDSPYIFCVFPDTTQPARDSCIPRIHPGHQRYLPLLSLSSPFSTRVSGFFSSLPKIIMFKKQIPGPHFSK